MTRARSRLARIEAQRGTPGRSPWEIWRESLTAPGHFTCNTYPDLILTRGEVSRHAQAGDRRIIAVERVTSPPRGQP